MRIVLGEAEATPKTNQTETTLKTSGSLNLSNNGYGVWPPFPLRSDGTQIGRVEAEPTVEAKEDQEGIGASAVVGAVKMCIAGVRNHCIGEAEATPKQNEAKRLAGLEQQQRLRIVDINPTQM